MSTAVFGGAGRLAGPSPRFPIVELALIGLAAVTSGLRAQQAPVAPAEAMPLVPIHTQADDPIGGAYGTWCAGPGFKASFHDGFTFYPFVGSDAERHLPFAWTTVSVRRGDAELVVAGRVPTPVRADLRFEYRHGNFVEAYDLGRDGIEQSFVLPTRPAGQGDLVVAGRLRTPLLAEDRGWAHAPIAFVDEAGVDVLGYGAAFAVDAAGDRVALDTRKAGDRIELRVPEAWLETATFPVVVDPIINDTVHTGGFGLQQVLTSLAVASTANATQPRLAIVYSLQFNQGDEDAYVILTDATLKTPVAVWSDLSTSWSSKNVDVAFGGSSLSWLMAMERDFGTSSGVRVLQKPYADTDPKVGTVMYVSQPSGRTFRRPSIGGGLGANSYQALVAFEVDVTSTQQETDATMVACAVVDAQKGTIGAAFDVLPSLPVPAARDRQRPSVTPVMTSGDGWAVAWEELDPHGASARWTIWTNRVLGHASVRVARQVSKPDTFYHFRSPRIAGDQGRFLVTAERRHYQSSVNGPLYCFRVDWPVQNAAPAVGEPIQHKGGYPCNATNGDLSYDRRSGGHWWIAQDAFKDGKHEAHLDRVGHTGHLVEDLWIARQTAVYDAPLAATAAAHGGNPVAFAILPERAALNTQKLHLVEASHSPKAYATLYGTGCGAATISGNVPYAGGSETWRLHAATPSSVALLALGTQSLWIDLGLAGAPGCFLHTSLDLILPLPTDAQGNASLELPLADAPVFRGVLFSQWIWVAPNANKLGFRTTQGLRLDVD
ncbi:MAG: hypothetical protein R3F30_11380 [Planctomycetota bacterium]